MLNLTSIMGPQLQQLETGFKIAGILGSLGQYAQLIPLLLVVVGVIIFVAARGLETLFKFLGIVLAVIGVLLILGIL